METTEEETEERGGCGYTGKHFGAWYVDGICSDGTLWDLDSCDEPGGGLRSGGDIPCPSCCRAEWLEYHREDFEGEGYAARENGEPRQYVHKTLIEEKDGDETLVRGWWESGWDQADKELTQQPV